MDSTDKNINYTAAQIKGRRLRMARALTGLSRQDLHDKTGIATSTMDTWESGRVELTGKSAQRVCDSFQKLGIFCSAEWLLSGNGTPPHLMNDTEKSMFIAETPRYASKDDSIRKKNFSIPPFLEINVKKELSFFLNLHERAMFCIVREKFLNSQFEIGDCVAGIEENPEFLLGKIVILQNLSDELFLCRLLKVGKNIATVFLNTKNPSVSMEFRKIARVIWHRKSKF